MALTPEQIDLAIQQHVDPVATYGRLHNFARAVEAEVHKQDDALILQLVEALEDLTEAGEDAWSEERPCVRIGKKVITAGRARLENTP